MPVLEKLLGQKQVLSKRKIRTVEEFAAAFPQTVEVIVDGMERPVRRAKKNDAAQALFGQEQEACTKGDCHRGCKASHRLSVAKHARAQA